MEFLTSLTFFVHAAETHSFSEAGRMLGVSSSTVGKSILRLEKKLGVTLLRRSTRSITLTAEGALFMARCRRILDEMAAAELEISNTQEKAQGKLKVSLPLVGQLVMPAISGFMKRYPEIELDLDFTDRMVDVIEEGFDAVVRTGLPNDSRLISRQLGIFKLILVASPDYLHQYGTPEVPSDLQHHACLQHKFPNTGKIELWPLVTSPDQTPFSLPTSLICNTTEVLIQVAKDSLGIACLPDFMVEEAIKNKQLVEILPQFTQHQGEFRLLWPSSKHQSLKLRVFIDYMVEMLFPKNQQNK